MDTRLPVPSGSSDDLFDFDDRAPAQVAHPRESLSRISARVGIAGIQAKIVQFERTVL